MSLLLIDDRERHVMPFIELYILKEKYQVARLPNADYIVFNSVTQQFEKLIERKTWKDLSSSIKDNRIANNNSLIKLRELLGCEIIFIIEGKKHRHGGVSIKSMMAKITNMQERDNFTIKYTKSQAETASYLNSLIQQPIGGNEPFLEKLNLDVLKIEKTDQEIYEDLLRAIPNVGNISIEILKSNSINLKDIILGLREQTLIELFGNKRANSMIKLRKASEGNLFYVKVEKKVLSAIPGISPAIADLILRDLHLSTLLNEDSIEIVASKIYKNKKIGLTRAKKIHKFLNYTL